MGGRTAAKSGLLWVLSAPERAKPQGSLGGEDTGDRKPFVDSLYLLCLQQWDDDELHQRLDRDGKWLPHDVEGVGARTKIRDREGQVWARVRS